jgi:hypothetical protein
MIKRTISVTAGTFTEDKQVTAIATESAGNCTTGSWVILDCHERVMLNIVRHKVVKFFFKDVILVCWRREVLIVIIILIVCAR